MTYDDNNIFARILRAEIPCNKIHEDEHTLAFHDIAPKAPVHILVIPKGRYISIDDFNKNASAAEITAFWRAVSAISQGAGVTESGYRIISNHGADAQQEVPHFHIHILGNKLLGPLLAA